MTLMCHSGIKKTALIQPLRRESVSGSSHGTCVNPDNPDATAAAPYLISRGSDRQNWQPRWKTLNTLAQLQPVGLAYTRLQHYGKMSRGLVASSGRF